MSALLIVGLSILVYLAVLAAWVYYWGRKKGKNGSTRDGYYWTREERFAVWGLVWPLFAPAGIIATPFAILTWIGVRIVGLFEKGEDDGSAINRRQVQVEEVETGISVSKKKPLPGRTAYGYDYPEDDVFLEERIYA